MLKSAIVAASLIVATAAFAQSNMSGGAGKSEFAPGQQPNSMKAPGHSESAPGQTENTARPGNSASTPGQQSTTGSAASDRTKEVNQTSSAYGRAPFAFGSGLPKAIAVTLWSLVFVSLFAFGLALVIARH